MRKFAKILSMVLVVATLATLCTFASSAANFKDVSAKDEALYDAVQLLNSLGIAKGQSETTYGANKPVTREQMAAFIYRLMKGGRSLEGGENLSGFTDLVDPTFFGMISWASDSGVIKGRSATEFDPSGKISLQDCYVMITRALGYEKDEPLAYPHEYIDIAERIGLDKNIDYKKVEYTDNLNRGQVAIILYNAFYAEMDETYEELYIPAFDRENVGAANQFVYIPTPETVCHKIYGIEEIVRRVVATPNYAIDLSEIGRGTDYKAYKPLGGETIDEVLIQTAAIVPEENSAKLLNEESVILFSDLGLDGNADDYFLRDITMYVQKDGTILAAFANGKVVTESTASIGTKAGEDHYKDYYHYNTSRDNRKMRSGVVNFLADKAYFWNKPNDVPNYSWSIVPTWSDDEGRMIFTAGRTWANKAQPEFPEPGVYTEANKVAWKDQNKANHENLVSVVSVISTSGGRYNTQYYDSNSDGIVDYFWVQPYTFGKIVDKKGDAFTLKAKHTGDSSYRAYYNADKSMPEIYVGDAKVVGGSYENGKYVYAYVCAPGNYIRIAPDDANAGFRTVIANPVKYDASDANSTTWSDGTGTAAWNSDNQIVGHISWANHKVSGLLSLNSDTEKSAADSHATGFADAWRKSVRDHGIDTTWEFVVNGGRVYLAKILQEEVNLAEDYAVIQFINEDELQVVFKAGGIGLDGGLETKNYVRAFINGEFQLVPITKENENSASGYQDDNYFVDKGLVNNICSYTVGKSGEYTFDPYVPSAKAADLADKEMESKTYGVEVDGVTLKKVQNKLYQFVAPEGGSVPASLKPNGMKYVTITDSTKIVVNYIDEEGESDYVIYDAANLPNFDASDAANVFTKAIIVLSNNPDSVTNENLAFVYAEIGGEIVNDSKATENYAIILSSIETVDEDGKTTIVYKTADPKTGEVAPQKETAKASSTELAAHSLYLVTEAGFIKNTTGGKVASLAKDSADLVKIESYEETENILILEGAGDDALLTDENTIYALYDRSTGTVTIEDVEMLSVTAEDDTENKYYNEGEDALTVYVVSEERDDEEFEFVTLMIVARG